jgi:hypothetical protein
MAGRTSVQLIVVWVGFFPLFRARMEKICRTAPIGQIVPIQADIASPTMQCAGLRRRAGRGRDMAGRTSLQFDCCVVGLFFALFREKDGSGCHTPPPA